MSSKGVWIMGMEHGVWIACGPGYGSEPYILSCSHITGNWSKWGWFIVEMLPHIPLWLFNIAYGKWPIHLTMIKMSRFTDLPMSFMVMFQLFQTVHPDVLRVPHYPPKFQTTSHGAQSDPVRRGSKFSQPPKISSSGSLKRATSRCAVSPLILSPSEVIKKFHLVNV